MFLPDTVMRWLGPTVVIVIGVSAIFGFSAGHEALCEPEKNCLISWVGALSGWAALAGALLTIGVMREQLKEQRRQTDHMMGDSQPDMFLDSNVRFGDDEFFSEVRMTVVNRNRRPLHLHRIEFEAPEGIIAGIRSSVIGDKTEAPPLAMSYVTQYIHRTLPGKEEGQPARHCVIDMHLFEKAEEGNRLVTLDRGVEQWSRAAIRIKLHCIQKDADKRTLVMEASTEINF
ncbi:hypothetical protein J2W42_002228 [Rhizobium tibeticum]|uniref:hypothetical protein n=1 Tax=Rhizobium tibeticum TaxID=501024 RepID=UPI0027852C0B|nr:hypothetical protein [Rhizobium tibeticum]MDP9809380.1 hypothetical protein [Rhizobium tibeticum]